MSSLPLRAQLPEQIPLGSTVLHPGARELRRGATVVHLSPKALDLLLLLIRRSPNVVSKREIQDRLWPDSFVSEASLTTLVREVRAAIGDDARSPRFIRTAHRFGYAFQGSISPSNPGIRAVGAVFPLTGGADSIFLEGVGDSISNALARRGVLRLVPRSTVTRVASKVTDPGELGGRLSLGWYVAGRLQEQGDELVWQLELVDFADGSQLWGERKKIRTEDLPIEVERLAGIIAARLEAGPAGSAPPARAAASPEAIRLRLAANHHLSRRTPDSLRRACDLFYRATTIDPDDMESFAGAATAWVALGSRGVVPSETCRDRALEAADRALAISPALASARVARAGALEVFDWGWDEAEIELERALALEPSSIDAHHWHALHLIRRGRTEEAIAAAGRAVDQDPAAELSVILAVNGGFIRYLARRPQEAAEEAERALALDPFAAEAHLVLGFAFEAMGNMDAAAERLLRGVELTGRAPQALSTLAHLEAGRGRKREAVELLREMEGRKESGCASLTALVHLALGDRDQALGCFERAVGERSPWLVYAGADPRLDPLRGESRFEAVLDRIGLPSHPRGMVTPSKSRSRTKA